MIAEHKSPFKGLMKHFFLNCKITAFKCHQVTFIFLGYKEVVCILLKETRYAFHHGQMTSVCLTKIPLTAEMKFLLD